MSEVPNLHPLFVQLQTRYPTSGLLTELVQIHADQFVVRAIVQVGNTTLATSLASAAIITQAEDQARLRVLALLGIDAGIHSTPLMSLSELSVPSTSMPMTAPVQAFQDTTLPTAPMKSVVRPDSVTLGNLPDSEAIAPPASFAKTFEPVPLTDRPKASFSTTTIEPTGRPLDLPEIAAASWEAPLDEVSPDDAPPDRDEVPYADEPYDEADPLIEEDPDLAQPSTDLLPAIVEAPEPKSKPRKPSTSKEPPPLEVDSSESTSRDLSSLISQIGVEIDRIGWSKRQGSTYLQKTYGKKTRSELTDDELEDFLSYLNTQPSAGEG